MFLKRGSARLVEATTKVDTAVKWVGVSSFTKWASTQRVKLDTDNYVYLRNRAISSLEYHGPNDNGDAFERDELIASYSSFRGCPFTIDHNSRDIIGSVVDTVWRPYSRTLTFSDNSRMVIGDWVENVPAISKEMVRESHPYLIEAILDGDITDTSMGCLVEESLCNVCGNLARDESEFCDHIQLYKGKRARLGSNGEMVHVAEINRKITFFEDSLIRPVILGGTAGGQGADSSAHILERIASTVKKDFPLTKQDLLMLYEWMPTMSDAQKSIVASLLKSSLAAY